jgi:hypothetical protein
MRPVHRLLVLAACLLVLPLAPSLATEDAPPASAAAPTATVGCATSSAPGNATAIDAPSSAADASTGIPEPTFLDEPCDPPCCSFHEELQCLRQCLLISAELTSCPYCHPVTGECVCQCLDYTSAAPGSGSGPEPGGSDGPSSSAAKR